jgi:O-antigen/teichoic acid export membrane protein
MADPSLVTDLLPEPAVGQDFHAHIGRISCQSSIFFAGTIFTAVAGYLFKVYVARMLGASALGIYALGMTVTGLVGVFAAAGLPQSATRFVAAYSATGQTIKLRGFLYRAVLMLVGLQLLGGLIILAAKGPIATRVYHSPVLATYMWLFVVLMAVGTLTSFFSEVLAGYRDVTVRTIVVNFVGTPLLIVSVVAFVSLGYGLRGYLIGQLVSGIIVLALMARAVRRIDPAATGLRPFHFVPIEKAVIGYSTTLLGVQALEFLLAQTDRIALGVFTSTSAVGIYALAVGLTGFVPIALKSINQIFSPTIAELHARGEHDVLLKLYQTLTKWTLGLTIPLAFSVMIFARPLMAVFGHDFERGWPILAIVSAGELINCGVGSVGVLLMMSGEESTAFRIQMWLAPLVTVANFSMIAIWGLMGAAVVTAATSTLINLLYLRAVKRKLKIFPSVRGYVHLLPATVVSVAVLMLARRIGVSTGWQLGVIALSTIASYAVFLVTFMSSANREDKAMFGVAWERIKSFKQRR